MAAVWGSRLAADERDRKRGSVDTGWDTGLDQLSQVDNQCFIHGMVEAEAGTHRRNQRRHSSDSCVLRISDVLLA